MNSLGSCAGFYLKYCQLMDAIYAEEEIRYLEGVPDAFQILSNIKKVGKKAEREGCEFLMKIANDSIEILSRINTDAKIISKHSFIEDKWNVRIKITHSKDFRYGFYLEGDESFRTDTICGSLILYLWLAGRNDKAARYLKEKVVCRGEDVGWDSDDIILSRIELAKAPQQGLDIDQNWLKKEVLRPLYALTQGDMQKLCEIAGNE